MSFRIVKDATSWWPVRWNLTADDGSIVEQSIDLQFVRVGLAEFRSMFVGDETLPVEERVTATNDQIWARVVRGWRGVEDEAGTAMPMTGENVAALLDVANFGSGLGSAYWAFFRAIAETRLGNSLPSLAGGPVAADPIAAPEATPPA